MANLDTLKNAGLSDGEIKIYETLLENGGLYAGEIIKKSGLKRGDCYNKIYDLTQKNLIVEIEKHKKKYFELNSPETIEQYIRTQIENLDLTSKEIKSILPNIISTYNLSYHKPGVKFFEGEDAVAKITRDALSATSDILSFVDVEAVLNYASDINKKFIRARHKALKKKKVICADKVFNRQYFSKNVDQLLDVRFIKGNLEQFNINMQIYDNKVSYITVLKNRTMGIIIEDPYIAKMHRQLFHYIWSTGKSLGVSSRTATGSKTK